MDQNHQSRNQCRIARFVGIHAKQYIKTVMGRLLHAMAALPHRMPWNGRLKKKKRKRLIVAIVFIMNGGTDNAVNP
jgi:hypothetical protein